MVVVCTLYYQLEGLHFHFIQSFNTFFILYEVLRQAAKSLKDLNSPESRALIGSMIATAVSVLILSDSG
jgi:hypothetical protein